MCRWTDSEKTYAVMLTPGLVPGQMNYTTMADMSDDDFLYIIREELKRGHEIRLIVKPEDQG